MTAVRKLWLNLFRTISGVRELAQYLRIFLWALVGPRARLAVRLVAAESQLAMCQRRIEENRQPRHRFTPTFRLLWVLLSKVWKQWHQVAHLMQPATVKRWHTTAFRFYWRWKSRCRAGRPPISQEMQNLIRRLSRENPLWGADRIRNTLRLLSYEPPGEDTIRKYMIKPSHPRQMSTAWLPFLRNHVDVSWAIDFFTVVTGNFAFLYVFLVFQHGRRKVVHLATTTSPSLSWIIQQLREATPFGQHPRYLFRDNDRIYGSQVKAFLNSAAIEEVRIAYQSPWQNPYVERFIGTLRRELLDHIIVLSQDHLNRLLREFIEEYYHVERPHQGLTGDTPIVNHRPKAFAEPSKLISFPVCGGLHHRYERVAA
jgi:transposase InsO family protein